MFGGALAAKQIMLWSRTLQSHFETPCNIIKAVGHVASSAESEQLLVEGILEQHRNADQLNKRQKLEGPAPPDSQPMMINNLLQNSMMNANMMRGISPVVPRHLTEQQRNSYMWQLLQNQAMMMKPPPYRGPNVNAALCGMKSPSGSSASALTDIEYTGAAISSQYQQEDVLLMEPDVAYNLGASSFGESTDGKTCAAYVPTKLTIGKPHPDSIVETSSLSAVSPPDIRYSLHLPKAIIDNEP